MLIEAGAGTQEELSKVSGGKGLGLFVRSIVGMDREAAKRAFDGFLSGKTLAANQIHFVNLIVDYLLRAVGCKRRNSTTHRLQTSAQGVLKESSVRNRYPSWLQY